MENKYPSGLVKSSRAVEVFSLLVLFFTVSVEPIQQSVPLARITLQNLEHGHIRTITNKVNHEVVLTVPTKYFEAYSFECNSSYPVEWNYIGEGAPTATADVGRDFKDFYDVNTYNYQSILWLYNLEELQSGRYVCRGSNPEQAKLQIYYDLFVPGNGSRIFLSTSEKKVYVPEKKPIAVVPCTVTDPMTSINLYKGSLMGTYQKIETNQSIIFNPKKGFRLKMHELQDPFGTYLCTTRDNKRRRKINLIPERLKSKIEASNTMKGKIPVQFSYDYEFNRVLCCTGTPFVPKLQWAGCASVLDCKIKSVCFEEDRCELRLGTSSYTPAKWADPGPLPKGCSGWKLMDDPHGDQGIFKCSSPGVSKYQPYMLNRGNIFLDFEKAPASEAILSLVKTSDEEPAYVGSEIEYLCNSTRFYFAYGIRWAFQRGNGDIEFVEDSTVVKDRFLLNTYKRQTTFKILHRDIKAIVCFVPIANSATEWRTVSLPIQVLESFNIPGSLESGQADRTQEFLSNEIAYNSRPSPYKPYSTPRPKGYFNYQIDDDLLVSNNEPLEAVLSSSKPNRPVTIDRPNPLQEPLARDYLYSETQKQVPLRNNFQSRSKERTWDNSGSYSTERRPAAYVNIQTDQFEPDSSGVEFFHSTQASPTLEPKRKFEPQPHNHGYLDHHSWPKYSDEFRQFPILSSEGIREEYPNYPTSTSRPTSFFDYRVNSHEVSRSKTNNPNVFSSVRTSPIPAEESIIHYDTENKEYSLRYPSTHSKIHTNTPTGSSHRRANGHNYKYPTSIPTQPSSPYYTGSYADDGQLLASNPVLPPQEESHASSYGGIYQSGSSERFNERRNRLKPTTPSPLYYNYTQGAHYQANSWERLSSPPTMKSFDDYDRERQYHNPRESSPLRNTADKSSSAGTDDNFYYQRYASESQEFPVDQSNSGGGPGYSYNNDNFIRRSNNMYGDSVPMIDLG